jgi:hypothetical protein
MKVTKKHVDEYQRRAEQAGGVSVDILADIEILKRVNQVLAVAFGKLDGRPPSSIHIEKK